MHSTRHTRALAYDILAYWERFNHHEQSDWIGDTEFAITTEKLPTGAEVNVCGTTLCAAGTAVFLSMTPSAFRNFVADARASTWERRGARLLGLTDDEANQVFFSNNKAAKRFMKAIASGSQVKFDKAALEAGML